MLNALILQLPSSVGVQYEVLATSNYGVCKNNTDDDWKKAALNNNRYNFEHAYS